MIRLVLEYLDFRLVLVVRLAQLVQEDLDFQLALPDQLVQEIRKIQQVQENLWPL